MTLISSDEAVARAERMMSATSTVGGSISCSSTGNAWFVRFRDVDALAILWKCLPIAYVLADLAERADEIDLARAQAALSVRKKRW
jgi:hypothetical protein